MTAHFHTVVWIDHREARVFQFSAVEQSKATIRSHLSVQRAHRQHTADHEADAIVDKEFYERIITALNHTGGTLLAGPGRAKLDLHAYIRSVRPMLALHLYEVDTPDHPGDDALVAIARTFFQVAA